MNSANLFRVYHRTAVFLAALFALPCISQNLESGAQVTGCLKGLETQSGYEARYRALREFEDPGTHQHWLLMRDQNRASGPALLVKVQHAECALLTDGKMNPEASPRLQVRPILAIHPGDRLTLLEHTSVVDAELEATALQSAAVGDLLTVRLNFGGLTVRAIASAPGYATVGTKVPERMP